MRCWSWAWCGCAGAAAHRDGQSPSAPPTRSWNDAFLEHYGLASLSDLPGAADMRALGLLSLDLPANFTVPDPTAQAEDEDPLDPGDAPQFHQDYLGEA
jgi:segregation and condensation protein B